MSVIYINSYQFAATAPPSGYDPDAAAYIARVEGASGDNQALETAVKDAINAFVVGCKADGIWNAIKASCILAGARTLNGALQPLITGGAAPTNVGPFVETDYNRKTGLKSNGAKYLNANVKPSDFPQNSHHFCTYVTSTATSSTRHYIGTVRTHPNNFSMIIDNGGAAAAAVNSSATTQLAGGNIYTGFFGAQRPDSATQTFRFNGETFVATPVASLAPNNLDYFVFGRNLNGSANGISDRSHTFYSIGESLNLALLDTRVTTLINAFAAAIP